MGGYQRWLVRAPSVQPQRLALLLHFRERSHPENPKIGCRQLHTRHRTLFRTILSNPTIHRAVPPNLCYPTTAITFPLSFSQPGRHRYSAIFRTQGWLIRYGVGSILRTKTSRTINCSSVLWSNRELEAFDRCSRRPAVPMHKPVSCHRLHLHPVEGVCRNARDPTIPCAG